MQKLLSEIRACEICKAYLPLGPRPIVAAHGNSSIVVIGQAPGVKVHETGIPWDDPSGKQLRNWMGVSDEVFYDSSKIALVPMGFCYPGKGTSGDLPPRPECAPLWHGSLLAKMQHVELVLLIGRYAQNHYLGTAAKKTLTETVSAFESYLPQYFPLPHPSPRNRFWLAKNPWFLEKVVPELQARISKLV
ncbi:uracil-DNA glycosylase family protein [Maribacter polysaccharolyticus]|uniref:uracil-DNA glycosylase family protein n=1 Tax=Maribacter polysaccharolyticus TaxID=3020831 RepID=UPI00237FA70A|nr:uracil-DNA glycosylase family protein [Maribacter polysaccharolyticus]MDE3743222.1 uracil-DNA glycosylase family protein [Maribacter polysaccharolyticus]